MLSYMKIELEQTRKNISLWSKYERLINKNNKQILKSVQMLLHEVSPHVKISASVPLYIDLNNGTKNDAAQKYYNMAT